MPESSAPTNDILYRRLIMDSYHTTLTYAVDLQIFINTPKIDRKGRINIRANPFRREFLKYFSMSRNIKSIERFTDEASSIEKWFKTVPSWKDDAKLTRYYKHGISLLNNWNKHLIEQGVIEFR